MKFFHLHELSYSARLRRNKIVIWCAIMIVLWFFLNLGMHPDRLLEWLQSFLHLFPD